MALFKKKNKRQNLRPAAEVISSDGIRNSANALFANVRFMEVDERIKNIVITSSVPNEGKSTVAVALAVAIGASGRTCLLVETDMRRRSLANMLEIQPRYGTYALLTGVRCQRRRGGHQLPQRGLPQHGARHPRAGKHPGQPPL